VTGIAAVVFVAFCELLLLPLLLLLLLHENTAMTTTMEMKMVTVVNLLLTLSTVVLPKVTEVAVAMLVVECCSGATLR
jgi:hypothetical protein